MTLLEAVRAGDLQAVEAALASGSDPNQLGERGRTPLIEAAEAGEPALVERLLRAGAEPAWRDDDGETALLKAAANDHPGVVELLLPSAGDDDRALAKSLLAAAGGELRGPPDSSPSPSRLARAAASVAGGAARLFGDRATTARVERAARAEAHTGRKR